MTLTLLPAVDIKGGQAVRLLQGVADKETVYGVPVEAAAGFQRDGAQWLHVVDLDAAFGSGSNLDQVREIVSTVSMQVEVSGGIRSTQALVAALNAGAARVSIGTAALENPEWMEQMLDSYANQIAIDLAAVEENGEWGVRGHGWVSDGGDLWEVLERFDAAGARRFVVTDVSRDGALTGPNIELLREVAEATEAKITASGGVSSLTDLTALAAYEEEGIDAVIVGKALYAGQFTLPEALAAVAG